MPEGERIRVPANPTGGGPGFRPDERELHAQFCQLRDDVSKLATAQETWQREQEETNRLLGQIRDAIGTNTGQLGEAITKLGEATEAIERNAGRVAGAADAAGRATEAARDAIDAAKGAVDRDVETRGGGGGGA